MAVIGLSMSAVSAGSVNLNIKNKKYFTKGIGHSDRISTYYHKGFSAQCDASNIVHVDLYSKNSIDPKYYKLTKAKVYYKYKGKVKTKTYKAGKWGCNICKKVPKGYTPYKVTVWYKKKGK